MAVVEPSVFVIARSTRGVTLSESVDELFAALVSVKPVGAAIVAVLVSVPVPAGVDSLTVAVRV